jgi:hypothetical protein
VHTVLNLGVCLVMKFSVVPCIAMEVAHFRGRRQSEICELRCTQSRSSHKYMKTKTKDPTSIALVRGFIDFQTRAVVVKYSSLLLPTRDIGETSPAKSIPRFLSPSITPFSPS